MTDDLRTRARGVAIRSAALFEAAWDEGNAMGLDGWTGPGRGTEPDQHAIDRRERTVDRLVDDLYSRVVGYLAHAAQQPSDIWRQRVRSALAAALDVDELVVVLHHEVCTCDSTTHPQHWTKYARAVVAHLTKGTNDE